MAEKRSPGPLNLVYGDDELMIEELLASLISSLADSVDLDFNADTFEAGTDPMTHVLAAAENLPFGSRRRLVVLRQSQRLKEAELRPLRQYAEEPVATTVLILHAVGLDKRSKLPSLVPAANRYLLPRMDRGKSRAWLRSRFKSRGFDIADEALELLLEHIGTDTGNLDNAARLICLYYGTGRKLEPEDLAPVLSGSSEANTWELLDMLSARRLGPSLKLLRRVLAAGDDDVMKIFSNIARSFRNLLAFQSARSTGVPLQQLKTDMNIWSSQELRRLQTGARRFTSDELTRILSFMHEADMALKTSAYHDPGVVLEILAARIVTA
ncbi:MAG: DNA polymerase III subunit delta [Candidatus Geothermincolia bacterium]